MKIKVLSVITAAVFLLCSCSRQEGVTAEVFIRRAEKDMKNVTFDIDNSFFDENGYHCFCSVNGKMFLISCLTDDKGVVFEASVTSDSQGLCDEFKHISTELIKLFPENELAENIFEKLAVAKNNIPQYFDSQWFMYSLTAGVDGCNFSLHDKKLMPEKIPQLTLRENER